MAYFDGLLATDLIETADLTLDPEVLDRGGWWAVMITFEGAMTGYRFRTVTRTSLPPPMTTWTGPTPGSWRSSLDRGAYLAGVRRIHRLIEAGEVYQVNLCRMLSAPWPSRPTPTLWRIDWPAATQPPTRECSAWVTDRDRTGW